MAQDRGGYRRHAGTNRDHAFGPFQLRNLASTCATLGEP